MDLGLFKIKLIWTYELRVQNDDEEDVSYDAQSLFTNILVGETINYIIDQIYNKGTLVPISMKLIFKQLLKKFFTEVTFNLDSCSSKQIDGCKLGGPLSVTICDIYMIKMEKDVVKSTKPKFYGRFIEDIYMRRKIKINTCFTK